MHGDPGSLYRRAAYADGECAQLAFAQAFEDQPPHSLSSSRHTRLFAPPLIHLGYQARLRGEDEADGFAFDRHNAGLGNLGLDATDVSDISDA
jgi:hypothetical protein